MFGVGVGDGVQITFAQYVIRLRLNLHLELVIGAEQHLITDAHRAHVGTDATHLTPRQALGDLGGGGNQDAATAAPLARLGAEFDHHAVVQHVDFELGIRHGGSVLPGYVRFRPGVRTTA